MFPLSTLSLTSLFSPQPSHLVSPLLGSLSLRLGLSNNLEILAAECVRFACVYLASRRFVQGSGSDFVFLGTLVVYFHAGARKEGF